RDHYVVALTADHGVTPIPEHIAKSGRDGGRMDVAALTRTLESQLVAAFGPGKYIADLFAGNMNVYFMPGVYDRLRTRPMLLDSMVETIARAPGVLKVFRAEEFQDESSR